VRIDRILNNHGESDETQSAVSLNRTGIVCRLERIAISKIKNGQPGRHSCCRFSHTGGIVLLLLGAYNKLGWLLLVPFALGTGMLIYKWLTVMS
jgi:hypothetical protein